MLRVLLDKFWNEDVWLPPNTTWEDIEPGPDKDVVYADYRHLLYPLPLALVLIVLRHGLEKYWFAPFGKSLGIRHTRPKKAPNNPKLEAAYQAQSKIKHKQISKKKTKERVRGRTHVSMAVTAPAPSYVPSETSVNNTCTDHATERIIRYPHSPHYLFCLYKRLGTTVATAVLALAWLGALVVSCC